MRGLLLTLTAKVDLKRWIGVDAVKSGTGRVEFQVRPGTDANLMEAGVMGRGGGGINSREEQIFLCHSDDIKKTSKYIGMQESNASLLISDGMSAKWENV